MGCSGYIGIQCVRLLAAHPQVDLVAVRSRSWAGRPLAEMLPGSDVDLLVGGDLDVDGVDVVLAALPHTVAAAHAREWLDAGAVLVDMSADFRLAEVADYERWYGVTHPAPELCARAVYGLVEMERARLTEAQLVAAPGCYPTAALLASLPALRAGLVEPRVIVDAKSGVSGSGRSPSLGVHFAEVNESVRAYGVAGHRHAGEMLERMQAASGGAVSLTFVPHLVPMTRGILATVYLQPRAGTTTAAVADAYRELARREPFIRYDESPPSTKSVTGTNVAAVNCTAQGDTAVVTVAIDNLVKGAAGQGVQAMNVRFGLPETAGLEATVSWP
jgi:N-acetyl-gamma-glutamyl-phosphate reductase